MLDRQAIINARKYEEIVIEPFDEQQLGPNSYDFRLGDFFHFPHPERVMNYDPYSESHVRAYWGEPFRQLGAILIPPQTTVLGHSVEVIGTTSHYVARLAARSSVGRNGVHVVACSGVGDVGFVSRWTIELRNNNAVPIKLPIGMRIGQVLFDECGLGSTKPYHGKYGQGDWTPADLIPKLWLDYDVSDFYQDSAYAQMFVSSD